MRLPEPNTAVEKQRIERDRVSRAGASLGDAPGGGMSELIRLADDKILEDEALVESQVLRLVVGDVDHRGRFRGERRQRNNFCFLRIIQPMIFVSMPLVHCYHYRD